MSNQQQDLGLSSGRLAEIKLRLLDLPHTVWRSVGDEVERASNRGASAQVAKCCGPEVARFIASAPSDIDALLRELEVCRMHVEKLKEQMAEADKAALSARAEANQWRERATTMRRAWRDLNNVMDGKQ